MQLLSHDEFADTISWLPHGQSFILYDKKKFTEIILPSFFTETKFASFTRKLLRWKFYRVSRGIDTGAYTHKVSYE